jgi:hypothetical protein
MVRNDFIDIDKAESYVGAEPVSLAEAKAHCYVDGTDDDTYIGFLITACRQAIEDYCHISMADKTITVTVEVLNTVSTRNCDYSSTLNPSNSGQPYNEFELPLGPIKSFTKLTSISSNGVASDLVEGDDYNLKGALFKTISLFGAHGTNILIYETGYPNPPSALKLAILNEIAFRLEKRGDENKRYNADQPGVCAASRVLADKYRRMVWQ